MDIMYLTYTFQLRDGDHPLRSFHQMNKWKYDEISKLKLSTKQLIRILQKFQIIKDNEEPRSLLDQRRTEWNEMY